MDFDSQRGRVVNMNGGNLLRGIGTVVGTVFLVIMLWSSVAYVPAGNVGAISNCLRR